jgi:hypothetical protein
MVDDGDSAPSRRLPPPRLVRGFGGRHMDARRFDTLARSLTAAGSRRRALAALGGALSLVFSAPAVQDAAAKKKCPPCKKRKLGKCKGKKPDGTACADGSCQGGRCVASPVPPTPSPTPCSTDKDCVEREFCQTDTGVCAPCRGGGQSCVAPGGGFNTRLCCSNFCGASFCRDLCPSGAGAECPSGKCCLPGPPAANYCALTMSEACE